MTQLPDGGAVGAANDEPVIAAPPTLEDRLSAAIEEEPQAEEEGGKPDPNVNDEAGQPEAELTADDVPEVEASETPIDPPVSWKDEEKAIFGQLPPEVQKVIARREADREKFVQEKSQEAARTRQTVEREAVQAIQATHQRNAQALQSLMVQLPARPTNQQMADDPYTYAPMMDAYDNAVAHNQWVERSVAGALQQAQAAEQLAAQQRIQETGAWINDNFPEFLDATKGPEIKRELASTATALGIPAELTNDLTSIELNALREANGWRKDAEKYRALMASKMQKVRAAKDLPRVSRPGVPQGKNAIANERYTADREAMKRGDMNAAARAISRFL